MSPELVHFQKLLASWHADAFHAHVGVNDFGWCCLFSEAMQNVGLTASPASVNADIFFPNRSISNPICIDCVELGDEKILADMEGNVGAVAIAQHAARARNGTLCSAAAPFPKTNAALTRASEWPEHDRAEVMETVARATKILIDHRAELIASHTPRPSGKTSPRRV